MSVSASAGAAPSPREEIAGVVQRLHGLVRTLETDETAGLTEEGVRSLIGVTGLPPALLGVLEERERLVVTPGGLRRDREPRRLDVEPRILHASLEREQGVEQVGPAEDGRLAREIAEVKVERRD